MSKSEIKSLFFWRQNYWIPCGLNLKDQLWWRFMPGVVVNVKWPVGSVRVPNGDNVGMLTESADPNDHYRPWLEQHVGRQGWDWNWGMGGMDTTENRLTIKIRQKYAQHATIAALRWA
jgi:hypothetical protein